MLSVANVIFSGALMQTASAEMVNKIISNRMRIVVIEDRAQPAVFLRVILPRGENDDPPNLAGVSDLAAELVQKGAGARDADAMAELVDEMGASLAGESSAEYTVLGCNALSTQLDTAIDIVRDIVLSPRLDKREFSLLKDQMTANIKAQRSSPSYLAAINLPPAVFGKNRPQGRVKTEETVNAIGLEDVRTFHKNCLQGSGAIAFCIGDIDVAAVAKKLEEAFGGLPAGAAPNLLTEVPENLSPNQVVEVEKEGITQTTVLIGKPMPGRLSPQYYSTLVANYILGGGGFVSRLMAAVRAKEGKTYGIRSAITSTATPDLFDIKFTTRNEELVPSIKLTLDVMNRFIQEGPTDTEVTEAKDFYKGYFFLQTETPAQRAGKMLAYLYYGLGLEEIDLYPKKIDAVTRASAHEAAKLFFTPDHLTTCLVGPKEATRQAKEFLLHRP